MKDLKENIFLRTIKISFATRMVLLTIVATVFVSNAIPAFGADLCENNTAVKIEEAFAIVNNEGDSTAANLGDEKKVAEAKECVLNLDPFLCVTKVDNYSFCQESSFEQIYATAQIPLYWGSFANTESMIYTGSDGYDTGSKELVSKSKLSEYPNYYWANLLQQALNLKPPELTFAVELLPLNTPELIGWRSPFTKSAADLANEDDYRRIYSERNILDAKLPQ